MNARGLILLTLPLAPSDCRAAGAPPPPRPNILSAVADTHAETLATHGYHVGDTGKGWGRPQEAPRHGLLVRSGADGAIGAETRQDSV
jgi:hypothetical protein